MPISAFSTWEIKEFKIIAFFKAITFTSSKEEESEKENNEEIEDGFNPVTNYSKRKNTKAQSKASDSGWEDLMIEQTTTKLSTKQTPMQTNSHHQTRTKHISGSD